MPEFDVRLVTGDIDPVLEHQTPRHGDRLILDVVLCNDNSKKVVANGTPEDFRIIGRQLIEIADAAEPPTVASTEADYDAAEARYEDRLPLCPTCDGAPHESPWCSDAFHVVGPPLPEVSVVPNRFQP